ncbi:hypothetical protein P7H00_11005 [Enterococcus pseudoavium]|uniref:Uncharacterized protein n=1 Tax=Enterococcus pseudoavium TaxID=44007 RepID=A0AAE4I4C7_9ENTE|nr:hypothetical protein [Enterococcus pseudoavium]MDT2737639.1 hypothetical protein [Enterococcus pseudoavium]
MIMVYAKIRGDKYFIGTFNDLEVLHLDVLGFLDSSERLSWKDSIYFLMNGEEYKLILGDRNYD